MLLENTDWAQIPAAQYPFLKKCKKTGREFRGESIYTNGRNYYHKDSMHGEIEEYNKLGKHVGVLLPNGDPHPTKNAVRGRNIRKCI